jgi:hypothetical protein
VDLDDAADRLIMRSSGNGLLLHELRGSFVIGLGLLLSGVCGIRRCLRLFEPQLKIRVVEFDEHFVLTDSLSNNRTPIQGRPPRQS